VVELGMITKIEASEAVKGVEVAAWGGVPSSRGNSNTKSICAVSQ